MIFAGIDVDIITHEKALNAGIAAFGLWCWGMCYAQKHTTDGRLPLVAVMSALDEDRRVLRRAAVRLCTSGLWVESSDGSFTVFNYPKKNQTADQIASKRDERRARNSFNQQASRDRRRHLSPVTCGDTVVTVTGSQPSPPPSPPPALQPAPDLFGTASPPAEPVTEVKPRRKPETPCPPSGASAGEIRDWSERWKIPDGHGEFTAFLDHHRKSDARWRDWAAAWRTWLKNAARFASRGGSPRGAEITKQPYDPEAPWMKLPEVG